MRSRPAGNGTATKLERALTPKYATTTDLPLLARRADYALRVVSTRRDGHLLTRFYATLGGAEGAVRRAHGRGCAAALQLVRIVPTSIALADVEHLLGEDGGPR